MKFSLLFVLAFSTLATQASWFGSDSDSPEYTRWDKSQLQQWLNDHGVKAPTGVSKDELQHLVKQNWQSSQAWTYDRYASAQKSFQNIKDSTFDAWDESRLREFLLEQGVVAPSGPREQLLLLAKQHYRSYTDAASSFSGTASSTIESIITTATDGLSRTMDDSKDYIYSSWDESQLKSWLVSQGVLKSHEQKPKDEMLKLMRQYYASVADPVWTAWSDSFMREWLISHGIIRSDYERNRDALISQMHNYYFKTSDRVFDSWSDSDLKQWLVDHGVIRSDSQVQRDKMLKMVQDNYLGAHDTFWSAWQDSDMRAWLINHGYMKSDAQARHDELVKMMAHKYNDYSSRYAPYLTWPDARLRAYLRSRGLPEDHLLTADRQGLLQEVRIRYVQSTNSAHALYNKIYDVITSGVGAIEDRIARVFELVSGSYDNTKRASGEKYDEGREKANEFKKKTEL